MDDSLLGPFSRPPATRRAAHAHAAPLAYDYQDKSSVAEWGVIAGAYTRFGDVTELSRLLDDRFVVMGHGEEVALEFDTAWLPPLTKGWARDFLLYAGGYGKDMDVNSAQPFTVDPMPFHAMTRYPYTGDELVSRDPVDLEWLLRWNTRSP